MLRFREHGDLGAAHRLVCSHLRMVVAMARGYLGYGLPHADLIQEGTIGLMKAVKRFDPARGVRLASFAMHWIRAEIHEYVVRNWRLVKVATTKAQRKLFFNLRSMKRGESLKPEDVTRVARQLRVLPEEVTEMDMRLGGGEVGLHSGLDGDAELQLPAADVPEPDDALEARETKRLRAAGLRNALAALDARSRRIIEARWLREKDPASLKELAAEFNVSIERIRQIQQKAFARMRKAMQDCGASSAFA